MMDEPPIDKSASQLNQASVSKNPETSATAGAQQGGATNASAPIETSSGKKLTAEEQMALYEEDLKENDWGHQPC